MFLCKWVTHFQCEFLSHRGDNFLSVKSLSRDKDPRLCIRFEFMIFRYRWEVRISKLLNEQRGNTGFNYKGAIYRPVLVL